jgi:outer membrane protein OmpA-like peptidoglycan-associated protein
MVLGQIRFVTNGAQFKPTAYVELNRLVKLMLDNPRLNIRIEAHTNSLLSYLTALELSEQRAAAVVEYLMGENIAISRMQFKGYGRQQPMSDQNTPTGRMANQRIELLILD